MDLRDQIIMDRAPLFAVPRFDPLPKLPDHGHAYLAAEDGLWLYVQRPWLIAMHPVAVSEIPLPYGKAYPHRTFGFTIADLHQAINRFIIEARDARPNEAAAWVVWNSNSATLDYRPLQPLHATPGSITFDRPRLDDHETLAIDLHSHGDAPAFWSATDDEDDTGEVKLAVVVGEVNDSKPAIRIRLCLLGLFIDLDSPL